MPGDISRSYKGPKDGSVPSWMDEPSAPTRARPETGSAPLTDELATLLRGRARFLRDRGEVKSPELMERAADRIEGLKEANDTWVALYGPAQQVTAGQVYTDETGRVWHPHSGFWAWKTALALAKAEERLRILDAPVSS